MKIQDNEITGEGWRMQLFIVLGLIINPRDYATLRKVTTGLHQIKILPFQIKISRSNYCLFCSGSTHDKSFNCYSAPWSCTAQCREQHTDILSSHVKVVRVCNATLERDKPVCVCVWCMPLIFARQWCPQEGARGGHGHPDTITALPYWVACAKWCFDDCIGISLCTLGNLQPDILLREKLLEWSSNGPGEFISKASWLALRCCVSFYGQTIRILAHQIMF